MTANADHTVTFFIHQLQEGNRAGAGELWQHFYSRLVTLARKKLHARVRRVVDEEDVALRAIDECFRSMEAGKFPPIQDRDNLWAILAKITERRAFNTNRDELREKRGGGHVRGESVFLKRDDSICFGADATPGHEPSPEMIAEFAESFEIRLSQLVEKERDVALKKMQGYKNREIADHLNCSIASVERKLKLIREKWEAIDEQATE